MLKGIRILNFIEEGNKFAGQKKKDNKYEYTLYYKKN